MAKIEILLLKIPKKKNTKPSLLHVNIMLENWYQVFLLVYHV